MIIMTLPYDDHDKGSMSNVSSSKKILSGYVLIRELCSGLLEFACGETRPIASCYLVQHIPGLVLVTVH